MFARLNLFLANAALLLLSACSSDRAFFYAPSSMVVPDVYQRNDAALMVAGSGNPDLRAWEVQAAYSPAHRLALTFQHMGGFSDNNSIGFQSSRHTSLYSFEGGLGYYAPLGVLTHFGLYAGGGGGRSLNVYEPDIKTQLYYRRLYVQPMIQFKGELSSLACGFRVSRLHFTSGSVDYRIDDPTYQTVLRIEADSPLWLPELGFSAGLHFKPCSIKMNMNFNLIHNVYERYRIAQSNAALSLHFDLGRYFKK